MTKTIVAGACKVFINGLPFGLATSFEYVGVTPRRVIGGIDFMEALELAPTSSICKGAIGMYRIHGDGGLEGQGIVAPSGLIVKERYFSITVLNRVTGQVIFQADTCSVEEQRWTTSARGRKMGTMTFTAIGFKNEAEY